jgi:hypothetical protein
MYRFKDTRQGKRHRRRHMKKTASSTEIFEAWTPSSATRFVSACKIMTPIVDIAASSHENHSSERAIMQHIKRTEIAGRCDVIFETGLQQSTPSRCHGCPVFFSWLCKVLEVNYDV